MCGPLDENLREMSSVREREIRRRGSTFRVAGEDRRGGLRAIRGLIGRDGTLGRTRDEGRLQWRFVAEDDPVPRGRDGRGVGPTVDLKTCRRDLQGARRTSARYRAIPRTTSASGSALRDREDLSCGRRRGRRLRARPGGEDRPDAPRRRSGRASRLSAGRPHAEGGPLTCGRSTTRSST